MKKRVMRALVPVLALIATGASTGCAQQVETAEVVYVRVMNVQVLEIQPEPFSSAIRVIGSVEALFDVTVVSEEGGVVEEFLVSKGARVRRDQPIARLDSEVLEAQLDEGRAAAELAREQWERQKRLWEDQQIGTELSYIQARENARMRAAAVRVLEARLAKKTICSPIDGAFEDYYFERGEFAVPGVPFARIVSIDQVKITGGVPERFSMDVRPGTQVEINVDNCPDADCVESISFVGDTVDPESRTFTIEILLDNPGRQMKPGMIASMQIIINQIDDAVVVPQESVLRTENGYQVFVIEKVEGRDVAQARGVELGPNREDRVVIESGLASGELVVTLGQLKLGDGDLVNIVNGAGSEEGGDPR